jgi:hypothetical protein
MNLTAIAQACYTLDNLDISLTSSRAVEQPDSHHTRLEALYEVRSKATMVILGEVESHPASTAIVQG